LRILILGMCLESEFENVCVYNGSWVGALAPALGGRWRGSMGEAHQRRGV
jgi:hypothetical protein